MHHLVALRTNRTALIVVAIGFFTASCVDETNRSLGIDNSRSTAKAVTIAAGVNKSVKGTYRGQARFDLASDDIGYAESFTEGVVISVDKSGRATIVLGNKSANLVFDGDEALGEYTISRKASDYNCLGTIPYTLQGDQKVINGTIEGHGNCSNGGQVHVVQLSGKIRAIQ